jgi:DNA-binding transcriptional ArsR family regulator
VNGGASIARKNLKCVSDPEIIDLAENLRIISEPTRLRIICLLSKREMCVCEVERELAISQQLVSHHLSVLREAGFISFKKKGAASYYYVDRDRLSWLCGAFTGYLAQEYKGEFTREEDGACCRESMDGTSGCSRGKRPMSNGVIKTGGRI